MKLKRRTLVLLVVVIAAAALLGYIMRASIEQNVIRPLIFFWWVLGIYYRSLPQALIWIILVGAVIMIMIGSFTGEGRLQDGRRDVRKSAQGGVESLAGWFHRAPEGLYYKWLLAQRLGKLSRELIAFNARQTAPSGPVVLSGPGWDPPVEIASYLESGLNGSFADYPRPRWSFQRPAPTPLDLDPKKAIDYIESNMEKD
jgi:hypothetical protein